MYSKPKNAIPSLIRPPSVKYYAYNKTPLTKEHFFICREGILYICNILTTFNV